MIVWIGYKVICILLGNEVEFYGVNSSVDFLIKLNSFVKLGVC